MRVAFGKRAEPWVIAVVKLLNGGQDKENKSMVSVRIDFFHHIADGTTTKPPC